MAYLDKTLCNNCYETITQVIRFLCDDSATAGRDWQVKSYVINEDDPNNLQYRTFSGSLTVSALDTPIYLPTVNTEETVFTKGGTTLTQGTDYTLDNILGKVTFLSGGAVSASDVIEYEYKFKRAEYILYNSDGSSYVYVILKLQIYNTESEAFIRGGGCYTYDTNTSSWASKFTSQYAVCIWNNPNYLWIFSNQRRFIIVVLNEGYYSVLYAGLALRLCLPTEYEVPLVVHGSHKCDYDFSPVEWHDNQDNAHWFVHGRYSYMTAEDKTWHNRDSWGYVQPRVFANNVLQFNFPSDFPLFFYPIIVAPSSDYFVGLYEGVYYINSVDLTSESIITDDSGKEYIVFPDVNRNDYAHWHCILKE